MISVFNGRSRSLGTGGGKDVHVQVSVALRKHLHLFKGAKLGVFMAIALHSDENGWSYPSTKLLCKETGLNPDTIFKALGELCDLEVCGRRVLLRKGGRKTAGQFSNNHYLIFPTPEEIRKFETASLLAVSEKSDTVKIRYGKNPRRKKSEPGKSDTEEEPLFELEPQPGFSLGSLKNKNPTHTQEPGSNRNGKISPKSVCESKSKYSLAEIREYAFASANYTSRWNDVYPQDRMDGIRNPDGWAVVAHRTGLHDEQIEEYFAKYKDHWFNKPIHTR